jgi:hypothetical protein
LTEDQSVASPLPTHRTTQTEKMYTYIHTSSGLRTHDPSVRAREDTSCLRPRGFCARPRFNLCNEIVGITVNTLRGHTIYIIIIGECKINRKEAIFVEKINEFHFRGSICREFKNNIINYCDFILYLQHVRGRKVKQGKQNTNVFRLVFFF